MGVRRVIRHAAPPCTRTRRARMVVQNFAASPLRPEAALVPPSDSQLDPPHRRSSIVSLSLASTILVCSLRTIPWHLLLSKPEACLQPDTLSIENRPVRLCRSTNSSVHGGRAQARTSGGFGSDQRCSYKSELYAKPTFSHRCVRERSMHC
jgi:hypothetical protein